MQAEIITIGDEILLGQTLDSNSAWIAAELADIGIPVYQISSIKDTEEHIVESLEAAQSRSELIIITGGLGPTKDDITKATLANFFDTLLVLDEATADKIRAYFESRGRAVLPSNIQQAELPKDATIIPNDHGTASGMWFKNNNIVTISMPGVPYEMKSMMEDTLLPMIKKEFNSISIYRETLMTTGMGESMLADKIGDWEDDIRDKNLGLAYLPSPGIVRLRITSKTDENKPYIQEKFKELEQELPTYVFGRNDITLQEVVGELLVRDNKTVGVVESCTGGTIGRYFTDVPGASAYFMGSLVTYSYSAKKKVIGVQPQTLEQYGAVSEETVKEMAMGGKKALNSDYNIATSGIAGPGGGLKVKPVGTVWIAVATPSHVTAKKFQFGNHRQRNITMTTLAALNFLRIEILKELGDERFQ